ncbi:MAG: hypothetical protein COA79_18330 [Planctomycetota bacterium]|nr:MAG: hypothetical protein COA79_18330 [Planctomycetota bacterium]
MKCYYFLILVFLIIGCGQKKQPAEIVRIQKGSSLMRQVAPTLKRGSENVFLVGSSVSNDELNNYLNRHNRLNKNESKFQILYISGPKAKNKSKFRNRLTKLNKKNYQSGIKTNGTGIVIKKNRRKGGKDKNIKNNFRNK